MRYFFGILIALVAIFVYLNYSYNQIVRQLDKQEKHTPFTQKKYLLLGQGLSSVKYIALGDDLAAGVGAKDHQSTYSFILAKDLTRRADILTFINLSSP